MFFPLYIRPFSSSHAFCYNRGSLRFRSDPLFGGRAFLLYLVSTSMISSEMILSAADPVIVIECSFIMVLSTFLFAFCRKEQKHDSGGIRALDFFRASLFVL